MSTKEKKEATRLKKSWTVRLNSEEEEVVGLEFRDEAEEDAWIWCDAPMTYI